MKIKKECLNCKSEFEVEYKQRDKKYCNRTCYFEYSKENNTIGRNKDNNKYEIRKCKVCDSEYEVRVKVKKELCSDECRKKWALIDVNKVDRISKSKNILINNYGVDSVFKLKDYQDNIKTNFKLKYNVENPMHSVECVGKLKETIRIKQLKNLIPKLLINDIKLLDEYTTNKDGINNTSISYNFECLKCSHKFNSTVLGSGKVPICRKCHPIQKNSSLEIIVTDFLTNNNINYIIGDRKVLKGKELDIYIPSHNIAIEINGNYWHTENFGGKDKKYHINKTELCNNVGVKLIHVFEDELLFKKDIVFSRLTNILGLTENKIYARKCDIRSVSFKDKKNFLIENHIQGNSIDKIRYGLYYNDELVSLITFSKVRISLGRKHVDNEWELNRFSSRLNTSVTGGFTKLLKHFIKEESPTKIITYADIRWSGINSNVYKNIFTFISQTPPNYWYVKEGQYLHRYHRFSFRKDVLVNDGGDYKKTEWGIMQERKYDRIWDCGNMKYEFNVVPTGASFDDI